MKRLFVLILLSGVVLFSSIPETRAGRPRRLAPWRKGRTVQQPIAPHAEYPLHYRPHYSPYDYYKELYPKYYGAFHSRHIFNYGYPSGDIGLRGTPW